MKNYGPGGYMVEVTLRYNPVIFEGESSTEAELIADCRKFGEIVDWEVE